MQIDFHPMCIHNYKNNVYKMSIKLKNKIINNLNCVFSNFNKIQVKRLRTDSHQSRQLAFEESPVSDPEPPDSTHDSAKQQTENVKLIQYTFNWGIGDKFREQSRNRYPTRNSYFFRIRPTHKKKETSATIPSNYFNIDKKFDNCKIVFDEVNEQWEVLWIEYNKLNGKPFPVKKYGIQSAKLKSLEFAESLNDKLNNLEKDKSVNTEDSKEDKILFDNILQCWVGLGRAGGRPIARAYSADYHGFDNSKQLSKNLTKS